MSGIFNDALICDFFNSKSTGKAVTMALVKVFG